MTAKKPGSPKRPRKRVLLPPDPPLRGTDGIWPDIIATVRPWPTGPFDGPEGLGVWFNDRAVVRVPEMAAWFNEVAARAGLAIGMVCGTDYFDIWETAPGACDHAELTDKGPVGQYLRVLRKYGGFSKGDTPEQHALAIRAALAENSTAIVETNEMVLRLAPPPKPSFVGIARRGSKWIDRSVGSDTNPDSRTISVGDPALPLAPNPNHPLAKPLGPTIVHPAGTAQFNAEKPFNYMWPNPVKTRVKRPTSKGGKRRKTKG